MVKRFIMYAKYIILVACFNMDLIVADQCNSLQTCGACISDPSDCVWCSYGEFKGPRCQSKTVIGRDSTWCPNGPYNPELKNPNIIVGHSPQFTPALVKMNVRPGVLVPFTISYTPDRTYPIEIYYLIDNSYTMENQKQRLMQQAQAIKSELLKEAKNVKFGVGSFVEKPNLPFAAPYHNAYSFKNHLPLSDDVNKFISVLYETESHGNYDTPESGLDALMQIMVCKEINWGTGSRKIIVLSTDSTYHSAGDGKLVGALQYNDKACHLKDHYYREESLIYDYPTIEQINKVAAEKSFTILFAGLHRVKNVYENLIRHIKESEYAELSESSQIPDIIKNLYLKIVQNLKITRNKVPPNIDLALDPPCTDERPQKFVLGENVTIQAKLTVTKCLPGNNTHRFTLSPVGLRDTVTIEVETQCECDCETNGSGEINSPKCSKGKGTHQCGICYCNSDRYGSDCECSGTSSIELDIEKCKADNDSAVCSGRGKCKCGECSHSCDENYYGKFCEYSQKDCPLHNNLPCAGNGHCQGKTCNCKPGWTGPECQCAVDTNECIGPNSKVCSGNGICVCGECKCNKVPSTEELYKGKYCNICEECAEQRCLDHAEFVKCYYEYKENCNATLLTKYDVKFLSRADINNDTIDGYKCKTFLSDESAIIFKYHDGDAIIYLQEEKESPPVADVWVAVGSAIGGVLLIGIVSAIVWKLVVDAIDRRDYEKFLKECADAQSDPITNPLFESALITTRNVAYNAGVLD